LKRRKLKKENLRLKNKLKLISLELKRSKMMKKLEELSNKKTLSWELVKTQKALVIFNQQTNTNLKKDALSSTEPLRTKREQIRPIRVSNKRF